MSALPNLTLISVDEYLNTQYDPDVEYVDGLLVDRKMGDWLHSLVQSNILFALRNRYPHFKTIAELCSRISSTKYRLPDVSLLRSAPKTKYLLGAAFLVVEVLSEGDVMTDVTEKLKEYANKGVENIWLVDPRLKAMYAYRPPMLIEVEGDVISTVDGAIAIPRSEVFAD